MQQITIPTSPDKKLFFASDFHLGAPSKEESKEREDRLIRWLNTIKGETAALFLVGDVFDFWFEYRHVAPKGFVRFLAKIASFTDEGIPVFLFHGNHDMWMGSYLEDEIGIKIYSDPIQVLYEESKLLVGHGDGLGPGDYTYKLLKRVFRNKLAQWLFGWLHPTLAFGLATGWSSQSRIANEDKADPFRGDDEWLHQYCVSIEASEHHDFYIFGHRHLPIDERVGEKARYINLGEWVTYNTYAEFDGAGMKLEKFEA